MAGGADDAEVVRHQSDLGQVEHPRQQLSLGEVAGGAEEDDDLVLATGSAARSSWALEVVTLTLARLQRAGRRLMVGAMAPRTNSGRSSTRPRSSGSSGWPSTNSGRRCQSVTGAERIIGRPRSDRAPATLPARRPPAAVPPPRAGSRCGRGPDATPSPSARPPPSVSASPPASSRPSPPSRPAPAGAAMSPSEAPPRPPRRRPSPTARSSCSPSTRPLRPGTEPGARGAPPPRDHATRSRPAPHHRRPGRRGRPVPRRHRRRPPARRLQKRLPLPGLGRCGTSCELKRAAAWRCSSAASRRCSG